MAIISQNSPGVMERVVTTLDEGKMVVYPTDTVYALGADATRADCVRQIFTMKKRDPEHPISVMVSSFRMLKQYAEVSPEQEAILKLLLPGRVTAVLEGKNFPRNLSPSGIAFRIPLNPLAAEIVESLNRPLTATSVNPSGETPAVTVEDSYNYFGELVDIYLDAGPLEGQPSSVIDLREQPELLREGADLEKVLKVIEKNQGRR